MVQLNKETKAQVRKVVSSEELKIQLRQIVNALKAGEMNKAIYYLFSLNASFEKMKPFIGRGEQLPTEKEVYDFNVADAITFVSEAYPELASLQLVDQKEKNAFLKQGALLQEAIQTRLDAVVRREDREAISKITIPSTMFKLFADVTNSNFSDDTIPFTFAESDQVAATLDFDVVTTQQQIRAILITLHTALAEGKQLLVEKCDELEKRTDNNQVTKGEIALLKAAIGKEEPSWGGAAPEDYRDTFNGLSSYIEHIVKSSDYINKEMIDHACTNFDTLVNNKVNNVLCTCQKEKGFFARLKEWVSDTTKTLFGFGKLSTKGTVTKVMTTEIGLFAAGKRKVEEILSGIKPAAKKPRLRK